MLNRIQSIEVKKADSTAFLLRQVNFKTHFLVDVNVQTLRKK